MRSFIKNLFKKQEKEKITVRSEELKEWFLEKAKDRAKNLDGAVQGYYDTIDQIKTELKAQREDLLHAKIRDEEQIQPRVKTIVLGHRTNYCRELNIFLNSIDIPEETSVDDCKELNEELKKSLDNFAEQTKKSFSASQHLFHKEVEAIAKSLGKIGKIVTDFLNLLERQGLTQLDQIKSKIDELHKAQQKIEDNKKEIQNKKTRLTNTQKNNEAKEKEIEQFKESKEFTQYNNFLEKRAHIIDQIAACEREITQVFLQLERALKKYEYHSFGEEQTIIKKYLHDTKEAITIDEDLKIWDVFFSMKRILETLGLKDDQKEKVKGILEGMKKEDIKKLQESYKEMQKEREVIMRHIDNNPALSKMKEMEYKKNHFEEQIKRLTADIEELEKISLKDEGKKVAQELKQAIDKALDIDITLVTTF